MLTPVRVRGKSKKKKNKNHVADSPEAESAESTSTTHASSEPQSRLVLRSLSSKRQRMKTFDEIAASQSQSAIQKRARLTAYASIESQLDGQQDSPESARLSRLESLPVELIQTIFLYSLEMNLPRSSRILALSLCSDRIYRALILLAFFPIHLYSIEPPAGSVVEQMFNPIDIASVMVTDPKAFQLSVFQCKWCNLSRVRAVIPDLYRIRLRVHWWGSGLAMTNTEEKRLDSYLDHLDGQKRPSFFKFTDCTGAAYTVFIQSMLYMEPNFPLLPDVDPRKPPLEVLVVPDKLLDPPQGFTEETVNFLELLRYQLCYSHIYTNQTAKVAYPRHTLLQGVHKALASKDARAVTSLLKLDEAIIRSRLSDRDAMGRRVEFTIDENCIWRNGYYQIPEELFRTAVRDAGDDPLFIQLLLQTNAESLPFDDSEITKWAVELAETTAHTNPGENAKWVGLGRWLLDFMVQLPYFRRMREHGIFDELFVLGRLNDEIDMGRRYFDEVWRGEQWRDWVGDYSYDVVENRAKHTY